MEEASNDSERVHEVCHAMEVVSDAELMQVDYVDDHAGGVDIGNACVENLELPIEMPGKAPALREQECVASHANPCSAASGGHDVTFATLCCETEIDKRHAAAANTAQTCDVGGAANHAVRTDTRAMHPSHPTSPQVLSIGI